jgi:glucokinase
MTHELLAFDIGGTQGRCGVVRVSADDSAETLALTTLRREANEDGPAWLARLLAAAKALNVSTSDCAVSFGGPVKPDGSIRSTHVPGWERLDLCGEIERALGVARQRIHVENDANAGALGEHRLGAGRGCRNMLFFTVSTGIGGGVILDGKLHRGAHGLAGEFGHMILDDSPAAPQYAAGKRGALEALACGPAMARDAAAALRSRRLPVPAELTARDVFAAAERGEDWARAVLLNAVSKLGRGMAAVSCAFDVERVVVGGGVALAGETFFAPLRQALNAYLPSFMEGQVEVLPAQLGDRAPMLGAAIACVESLSAEC